MCRCFYSAIGFAVFFLAVFIVAGAQAAERIPVPIAQDAPALDGKLDDACWKSAAYLRDFKSIESKATEIDVHTRIEAITQQTEAYVSRDSDFLYIGVRCAEAEMGDVRAKVEAHDGYVYRDDCVELFLDPLAGGHTYYQVAVNSLGTVADAFRIDDQYSDNHWDAEAQVATHKTKNAWFLEIALPFSAFGGPPADGDVWGFNIGRERYAGETEWSSWANITGGFGQPEKFGRIQFGKAKGGGVEVISSSRGWASPKGDVLARNVFRLILSNVTQSAHEPVIEAGRATKNIRLDSGSAREFAVPYNVPKDAEFVEFRVSIDDLDVYKQRVEVQPDNFPRVWEVEAPLFEELLSDEPPGFRKDGAMIWSHDLNRVDLWPFGVQHGRAWSADATMAMMAEVGFIPLGSAGMFSPPSTDLGGLARANDHKAILMGHVRTRAEGAPVIERKSRKTPFALDPVNFAAYLDNVEAALREHQDVIWGCFYADEFQEHQAKIGIEMWEEFGTDYAYLAEVDEIVRKEYGFGKYGLPESFKESNPYRWIAYRRWLNDRTIEMAHEFRKRVKAVNPEVRVMSMDPIAWLHPYDWSRLAEAFDIVTQQLYPSRNPDLPRFMTMTKALADLSGKPAWPVPHVEHYAASFTPEEVTELLSQVFRAGGKGFHFYLSDVRGNRAGKSTFTERFGAPRRWETLCDIVKRTRSMNELDFPEADCAVMFSNDAMMGDVAGALSTGGRIPLDRYTTLVGLLARAGVWFKFIDDDMVLRGTDLNDYKVVFVPHATFQRHGVIECLLDYARQGGTLVILDPEAFQHDIDGTDPVELRKTLRGPVGDGAGTGSVTFTSPVKASVPGWGVRHVLSDDDDAAVVARYEDGNAAVVRRSIGAGTALAFGFDGLASDAASDHSWQSVFRALAADMSLELDQPIWRFRFPAPELDDTLPEGICLTGNYVRWIENQAVLMRNAETGGRYRYVAPPDGIADQGGDAGWIAFSEGDLTDRPNAHTVGSGGKEYPNWCVTWKGDQGVVVFDFREPRMIDRASFWFRDKAPEILLEAGNDLENWTALGEIDAQIGDEYDVIRRDAAFQVSTPCRYVRVALENSAETGDGILLAEVEFWGAE
ncbi:MAG: sugar-binding protein [Candidatus Hydrogenedentota bacterium]